jgi:hypothetical protein
MVVAVCAVVVLPVLASAQTSGIAGLVKDASGAVLPGVTVEVASPVLIELESRRWSTSRTSLSAPS